MKKIINGKAKYYLFLLASVLLTVPFFVAAAHAGYYGDDYLFANGIKNNWRGSMFSTAFDMAIYRWRNSEGKWFANFYDFYFHPYFWNGLPSLHLLMISLTALSFLGLLLFCFALVKYLGLKTEKTSVIYFLFMVPLLCYREYWEVYLWFVGSVYQLTTMLFIWGLALLLLAVTYRNIFVYIASGIFLILMGGGMYNFVAVGCLAVFSLLAIEYYRNGKVNIAVLTILVLTCTSSLITIFAPGNFVRKAASQNSITLLQAIGISFSVFANEYRRLLFTTTFLGVALLVFLFGLKQKKRLNKKILLFFVPILFLMVYSTILPFVYGYNIVDISVRYNRAQYLIDVTTIVGTLLVCFFAGMSVEKHKKETEMGLKFAIVFSLLIFGPSISETVPARITTNYLNGTAQNYNDYWLEVYEIAEQSQGQDVVIEKRVPERVEGTTFNDLMEDPFYPNNRNFLGMFDVKSISILGQTDVERCE